MTDEIVELMAKTVWSATYTTPWSEVTEENKEFVRADMRRLTSALTAAGYAVVPADRDALFRETMEDGR